MKTKLFESFNSRQQAVTTIMVSIYYMLQVFQYGFITGTCNVIVFLAIIITVIYLICSWVFAGK